MIVQQQILSATYIFFSLKKLHYPISWDLNCSVFMSILVTSGYAPSARHNCHFVTVALPIYVTAQQSLLDCDSA